jgi:glycosyltransferase
MLRFLYKNNLKCAYLPKVIIKMEVGGASNQSLKNRKTAIIESAMAWKINDLKMPFYLPVVKPLRKIGQYIFKTVS